MRTFTVRDLDRQPGKVLDSCDKEGAIRIRRRNGKFYTIRPDDQRQQSISIPDFETRLKAIFPEIIPDEVAEAVDKLIAGE